MCISFFFPSLAFFLAILKRTLTWFVLGIRRRHLFSKGSSDWIFILFFVNLYFFFPFWISLSLTEKHSPPSVRPSVLWTETSSAHSLIWRRRWNKIWHDVAATSLAHRFHGGRGGGGARDKKQQRQQQKEKKKNKISGFPSTRTWSFVTPALFSSSRPVKILDTRAEKEKTTRTTKSCRYKACRPRDIRSKCTLRPQPRKKTKEKNQPIDQRDQ